MFLNYFALFLIFFVFLTVVYGIVYIHDIPYKIAKGRDHPHQDAIHAAGWVSLFTLHAIWPFLWIWATMYKKETGYGFNHHKHDPVLQNEVEGLTAQLEHVKEQLATLEKAAEPKKSVKGSPAKDGEAG